MRAIAIEFRDGTKLEFTHQNRAGGSYELTYRLEPGWCVVVDEWGNETSFPADTIKNIEAKQGYRGW